MRVPAILAVSIATLTLGACGGSGNADADGDGQFSADEMKSAASKMEPLQPGEYKMNMELVEIVDPAAKPEEIEQAKQAFAMMGSMAPTKCMTEEELKSPMIDMAENMQNGDCEVVDMTSNGGRMTADMVCKSEEGEATVKLDSTSTKTSTQMTMTAEEKTAEGPKRVVMKMGMERQGDCAQ